MFNSEIPSESRILDNLPVTLSHRMFYLIGLGLCDANDVTLKGLDAIKKCSRVYLEAYTSVLCVGKEILVN